MGAGFWEPPSEAFERKKVGVPPPPPRPPSLPWELVEVMSSSWLSQPPSALSAARTR